LGETQPSATANTDTSSANAQRILGLAAAAVPALVGVAMEGVHVGMRPYPADGHPVLGWLPGPGGSGCSNAYVAGEVASPLACL
jgi:glycine/D-amino acid oxidase-like deaminating enzyme